MSTRPSRDWIQISVTALPGLAAVIALIFTSLSIRATDAQLQISEQGQITDRYNAAISNLGSSSADVRLGGIYALQRIMNDSPRDQPTIVAVLCAFVRDHAPVPFDNSGRPAPPPASGISHPPTDIQAALTVVGTRNTTHDSSTTVVDFTYTDLAGAHLNAAKFIDADFVGANLSNVELTGAGLARADLNNADLIDSSLTEADLNGADLSDANLTGANLTRSNLTGVHLNAATLVAARLPDVDLSSADLSSADFASASLIKANLTNARLIGAHLLGASLADADLTDAILNGSNLTRADLTDANLSGASLTGVDLSGANLSGAKGLPSNIPNAKGMDLQVRRVSLGSSR